MLKHFLIVLLISGCSTVKVSNSKDQKKKKTVPKTKLLNVKYNCTEGLITHDLFLKRGSQEGCTTTIVSFTDGKTISFKNFVDNGNMFTSFHTAFDNFIVMDKQYYEGGGFIVINPTGSHEFFSVQSSGSIEVSPNKEQIIFIAQEDDLYVPIHELYSYKFNKLKNDLNIMFGAEEICTKINCYIYPDFPKTFIYDLKFVTNELIEGRKCPNGDRSKCTTINIRYDRVAKKWLPDEASGLIVLGHPAIDDAGVASKLYLPPEIASELKKTAPGFIQYPPVKYPANIVENYEFTKNQMMSAVTGDFNGDSKIDVIVQGADENGDVTYKIISSENGYKVSLFGSRVGGAKTIPALYNLKSTWQYGMKYFTYNEPGKYFAGLVYQGEKDRCPYEGLSEHANADGDRTLVYCWKDNDLKWDGVSGD